MDEGSLLLRVLLVEDNEHDRVAFCRALLGGQVAAEITECVRAEEALELVRADPSSFDVIVTDHGLPGLSGMELCKQLLKEQVPLPLVILTGAGSEQLAVEALRAGVDDYLIKDPNRAYLDLLQVVLPNVAQRYRDRLARKQSERALKESEERFAKAFHSAPIPITITTLAEGRIVDVNESFLRMIGYDRDELIGRSALELGLWKSPQERRRFLEAAEKSYEVGYTLEVLVATKTGQTRPVKWL